jgi:hypothetical protein
MQKTITITLLIFYSFIAKASPLKQNKSEVNNIVNNSIYFTENKGQVCNQNNELRSDVKFIGVTPFENLIIADNGFSHQLRRHSKADQKNESYRVDIKWLGCKKSYEITPKSEALFYTNFYNLNHTQNPILKVNNYSRVLLKNIYEGIDVEFYDNGTNIEYDYILNPGADFKSIQIEIKGSDVSINKEGDLVMQTPMGVISESSPKVFQNGELIKSKWIQLRNNVFGFEIEAFDQHIPLVIDPISRVWGTYYGDINSDLIKKSCIDQLNKIYVSGSTYSSNNIATNGSFSNNYSGSADGFILKINSNGNRIWCTYIGGNYADDINEIGLNANKLYITGTTYSDNNIATSNAYKNYHNSKNNNFSDGFIEKFDTAGFRIWGTYYGGPIGDTNESFNDFDFDSKNNLILTGTAEYKWLGTPGVFSQYTNNTNTWESIIVKFDSSGQRIFCSYFNGTNMSTGITNIKVGLNDSFYVSGNSNSTQGIATSGTFSQGPRGLNDLFIVKFTPTCQRIWGTYFGGSGNEECQDLNIDNLDNVYCYGNTTSINLPKTHKVHQDSLWGGNNDAFIVKINKRGWLVWSSYFGGEQNESPSTILINNSSNLFICGETFSKLNISIKGTYQDSLASKYSTGQDGYFAKFDSTGTCSWSTYYGGAQNDYIRSIITDKNNNIYIFGATGSLNNIVTNSSHQSSFGGFIDGFIVKFGDCKTTNTTITQKACKQYTWKGKTYTTSGTYTYSTSNYIGCDSIVTLNLTIVNTTGAVVKLTSCDSIKWKNQTIKNSVILFDTLKNFRQCDSIVEFQIQIFKSTINKINITACDSFIWKNFIFKNSVVIRDTFKTYLGCDSIQVLDLKINKKSNSSITAKACKNYTWEGSTYYQTGVYTKHYNNYKNCDSTVTLDLTIGGFIFDSISINSCKKQYLWRNIIATNSGWFYDTAKTTNACDTIHCLNLNLTPLLVIKQPATQYLNLNDTAYFVVVCNDSNANYKWQMDTGNGWFNLDNSTIIKGSNNDSLRIDGKLKFDGFKFRCIVYLQNCSDTSDTANLFLCPKILKQPIKKYVGKGNNTSFFILTDIKNAKYQWQANSGNGYVNLVNDQMYSGVNDSILNISNINSLERTTIYRCLVSTNNCSALSDTAVLFVLLEVRKNLCNEYSFVNVYPNPTKHYVNVILPSDKVGLPYKIIADNAGIIKTGFIQSEESKIDFTEYTSGVYLLVIGYDLLDCFKIVKITD